MNIDKGIYWNPWNPFTGCTPVGPACDNCWAKRMAYRFRGRFGYPADNPFRPTFHPERLDQVNSNQKPQAIALCFMSDPFHEEHRIKDIIRMLDTLLFCPQHTFIALTKRPERMKEILNRYVEGENDETISNLVGCVSVWDQESADRMIPILLQTNLANRIVSLEPCLGMVNIAQIPTVDEDGEEDGLLFPLSGEFICEGLNEPLPHKSGAIDGIILGGESGPSARPMHPDWARSVRDQCQMANIPFFFKQWGEWLHEYQCGSPGEELTRVLTVPKYRWRDGTDSYRVGKKAAGRLLDGRTWDDLPWQKGLR